MRFFWQDLRYGFRTLLRNPGFCAVAILALALGIGPNTAIFTMVNAVLLKPLPVPEPQRVVMIWGTMLKSGFDQLPVSAADYLDWKKQATSFDQMAAAFAIPEYGLNVSGAGEPERVPAATGVQGVSSRARHQTHRRAQFPAGGRSPRRRARRAHQQRVLATPFSFRSVGHRAHADGGWHPAHDCRRCPARTRRDGGRGPLASHRHRSQ